jgi:hypothetical protein
MSPSESESGTRTASALRNVERAAREIHTEMRIQSCREFRAHCDGAVTVGIAQ